MIHEQFAWKGQLGFIWPCLIYSRLWVNWVCMFIPCFGFYCEKVWFLIVIDWWVCVWDCVWMLGNNRLWVYWLYMFIPCFGFWLWKSFDFYCYWLMGMRLRLCLNAGNMCGKEMDGGILYWVFFFLGEWVCLKTECLVAEENVGRES